MLRATVRRRSPSTVYFSTSSRRRVSSCSLSSLVLLFSTPCSAPPSGHALNPQMLCWFLVTAKKALPSCDLLNWTLSLPLQPLPSATNVYYMARKRHTHCRCLEIRVGTQLPKKVATSAKRGGHYLTKQGGHHFCHKRRSLLLPKEEVTTSANRSVFLPKAEVATFYKEGGHCFCQRTTSLLG
jgi:hypothetical protein